GPHGGTAREQRDPDRARGARRDDRARRARPRASATRLERGARAAPALGPAVVAADPADPRLRDRPARVPRHLRGLEGDGRAGGARREMAIVAEHGGAVEAVSYMKTQLVESHRARVAAIESGAHKVVGQNTFTSSEPSPLQQGEDGGILHVDAAVEQGQIDAV